MSRGPIGNGDEDITSGAGAIYGMTDTSTREGRTEEGGRWIKENDGKTRRKTEGGASAMRRLNLEVASRAISAK